MDDGVTRICRVTDATHWLLELLEREGRSLHTLLARLTLRADVAEDLMQELFIKLARTPGITQVQNPSAYLHRAAIHLAFDWRRSQRHEVSMKLASDALADETPLPLTSLIQREQWQEILEVANDLSELSREAFVLHYVQEEPFETIAARLEKTPHQVRGLCHKAIRYIRGRVRASMTTSGMQRREDDRATD